MPNGKPGDHPLTDILHYGSSEFGDPVDRLVRELSEHPDWGRVRDEVSTLLWDNSPHWLNALEHGREVALNALLAIKARLAT